MCSWFRYIIHVQICFHGCLFAFELCTGSSVGFLWSREYNVVSSRVWNWCRLVKGLLTASAYIRMCGWANQPTHINPAYIWVSWSLQPARDDSDSYSMLSVSHGMKTFAMWCEYRCCSWWHFSGISWPFMALLSAMFLKLKDSWCFCSSPSSARVTLPAALVKSPQWPALQCCHHMSSALDAATQSLMKSNWTCAR